MYIYVSFLVFMYLNLKVFKSSLSYEIWGHIYTLVTIALVCQDTHIYVCLLLCASRNCPTHSVSTLIVNTKDNCTFNPCLSTVK